MEYGVTYCIGVCEFKYGDVYGYVDENNNEVQSPDDALLFDEEQEAMDYLNKISYQFKNASLCVVEI